MDSSRSSPRLAGWGRAAAVAVLLVAALNWIGWATGSSALTRLNRSWPHLLPWAALWLAAIIPGRRSTSGPGSAAPRKFAIERLPRDPQFGGHLLPSAPVWHVVALTKPCVETVGHLWQ